MEAIVSDPFQNSTLRDWFFRGFEATDLFPNGVGTLGTGPFEEFEFDDFLRKLEIIPIVPGPDVDILVVGREDWEDDLGQIIESRRGEILRVYSQEMLLSRIFTGNDPLEIPKIALEFATGHPALEHIREWGFNWPVTRLVPARGTTDRSGNLLMKEESLLGFMGYRVGAKGRDRQKRRDVLTRAFTADLFEIPGTLSFGEEWGPPKSANRLFKIAQRISMNVDPLSAGGRRQEAVSHWLEDLAWLRTEYYQDNYTFQWPSPIVA